MARHKRTQFKLLIVGKRWAQIFAYELNENGFDVLAIDYFEEVNQILSNSRYDLVILTSDDPILDRSSVNDITRILGQLAELREKHQHVKILVMDACQDTRLIDKYKENGAVAYIVVPFESNEAIDTIRKVLESADLHTHFR